MRDWTALDREVPKPWIAGSSTIWARLQTQLGANWGLNDSSEEGQISLTGAEDAQRMRRFRNSLRNNWSLSGGF